MNELKFVLVFVTAPNPEEAREISLTIVEEKLAACATTAPNVNSIFWWDGQVENADEQLIIFKALASDLEAIVVRVKSLHSYDVPEIIAIPIIGGSTDYLNWIEESVRK